MSVVLYMLVIMPMGEPVLLENNDKFETIEECQAVGEVKAPDIATNLANEMKMPIRYKWWCEAKGEDNGTMLNV